jgi:hypothetical protein
MAANFGGRFVRICRKCNKPASSEGRICRACGAILEDVADHELPAVSAGAAPQRQRDAGPKLASLPESPPKRPPLGLPSGSIRALLTLIVVGVVVIQLVRGHEVEPLWTETLMIVLAHYFTSRRSLNLPPDVLRQLAAEGHVEAESNPLYLPRHSIRAIIVLAFAGLAFHLYHENGFFPSPAIPILGVVCAYFLGMLVRFKGLRGWEDLKAGVVLAALLFVAGAYLLDQAGQLPHAVQNISLALVLFYFGSR